SLDPAVVLTSAGETGSATLAVSSTADQPATLRWVAQAPDGVTLEPSSGTLRVAAGGSASVDVQVSGPVEPGTTAVPVERVSRAGRETVTIAETELLVTVPFAELADVYTNVAVTTDGEESPPGLGTGFDGAGSSYSAQALADQGVTPGSELVRDGVSLTWPDA